VLLAGDAPGRVVHLLRHQRLLKLLRVRWLLLLLKLLRRGHGLAHDRVVRQERLVGVLLARVHGRQVVRRRLPEVGRHRLLLGVEQVRRELGVGVLQVEVVVRMRMRMRLLHERAVLLRRRQGLAISIGGRLQQIEERRTCCVAAVVLHCVCGCVCVCARACQNGHGTQHAAHDILRTRGGSCSGLTGVGALTAGGAAAATATAGEDKEDTDGSEEEEVEEVESRATACA
jgi:hypothetical protein